MELWIRSQDKRTLINTRRVDIDDKNIIVWDEGRYADEIYLGSYSSPERALEVLDEIQSVLQLKIEYKPIVQEEYNVLYPYKNFVNSDDNMEIKELSTFVYQMPKE